MPWPVLARKAGVWKWEVAVEVFLDRGVCGMEERTPNTPAGSNEKRRSLSSAG